MSHKHIALVINQLRPSQLCIISHFQIISYFFHFLNFCFSLAWKPAAADEKFSYTLRASEDRQCSNIQIRDGNKRIHDSLTFAVEFFLTIHGIHGISGGLLLVNLCRTLAKIYPEENLLLDFCKAAHYIFIAFLTEWLSPAGSRQICWKEIQWCSNASFSVPIFHTLIVGGLFPCECL